VVPAQADLVLVAALADLVLVAALADLVQAVDLVLVVALVDQALEPVDLALADLVHPVKYKQIRISYTGS
jgi:hypothetical protein